MVDAWQGPDEEERKPKEGEPGATSPEVASNPLDDSPPAESPVFDEGNSSVNPFPVEMGL